MREHGFIVRFTKSRVKVMRHINKKNGCGKRGTDASGVARFEHLTYMPFGKVPPFLEAGESGTPPASGPSSSQIVKKHVESKAAVFLPGLA